MIQATSSRPGLTVLLQHRTATDARASYKGQKEEGIVGKREYR